MDKLRLMTYNLGWLQGEGSEGVNFKKRPAIHFSSGVSAVAQTILDNQIDLCAFQEIDFNSNKSHNLNQFETLKEKTNMQGEKVVCWDIPFLPFPYHKPWGKVVSGGAVITNKPMFEVESALFNAPKDMFFLKRYFYLKRYAQVIKFVWNGQEEKIINVHLEAFDFKAKMEQLQEVAKLIQIHQPLVVMGDFNTLPPGANTKVEIDYSSDPAIKQLPKMMKGYKDIFTSSDLTFPTGKEDCRLDYIWVKKGIKVKKIDLKINFNPSDHLPLALEIWKEKP